MRTWTAAAAILAAAACGLAARALVAQDEGGAPGPEAKAAEDAALKLGGRVYADTALGTNDRSCSTCHSNPKRPDLTLKGVTDRFPRYDKNARKVISLQEKFMQMQERSLKTKKPLPLADERWTALELYLRSQK